MRAASRRTFPALPDGAVLNIGQIHGGNIFNAVPQELYFTVGLRSSDANGAHQLTEYAIASSALPSTRLLYLPAATFADGIKVVPPAKVVP